MDFLKRISKRRILEVNKLYYLSTGAQISANQKLIDSENMLKGVQKKTSVASNFGSFLTRTGHTVKT